MGAGPPDAWQQRLAEFDCDKRNPALPGQADLPDQPLLACDENGNRYLLGPMMVDGTDVTDAQLRHPAEALGGDYAVNVEFNGQGSKDFADVTRSIAGMPDPNSQGDQMRLAIVLDGEMLSNPSNDEPSPAAGPRSPATSPSPRPRISPTRSSTARCRWPSRSRPSPTKAPSSPPTSSRRASSPASSA